MVPPFRSIRFFLYAEREVILAFVGSRLLLWLLAWLAYTLLAHGTYVNTPEPTELWNLLFRWDAGWYSAIATEGYDYTPSHESRAAFFPLYPLCLAAVRAFTGASVPLAGFLLSNTFLLAAAILLRRLVTLDFPAPSRVPTRTIWLLLLYPVTFFHSAVYTESLFLLLSIGAIFAARQKRWAVAGISGALLTATRAPGLLILLPLLWEVWSSSPRAAAFLKWQSLRPILWLALVPLGLVSFAVYLHFRFGDALAFSHTMEGGWQRSLTSPLRTIRIVLEDNKPGYTQLFLGTEALAAAIFLLACVVRLRASYLIYSAAILLLLASNSLLEALPRYVSVIFPFQIALAAATARSEGLFLMLLVASTGLMAICLALFTGGYWLT
ncbi:MAG: mannosyltransferase family protein [Chthoniobacterales bacterium]